MHWKNILRTAPRSLSRPQGIVLLLLRQSALLGLRLFNSLTTGPDPADSGTMRAVPVSPAHANSRFVLCICSFEQSFPQGRLVSAFPGELPALESEILTSYAQYVIFQRTHLMGDRDLFEFDLWFLQHFLQDGKVMFCHPGDGFALEQRRCVFQG